jgi:pyruvate dehydrogenase E2 component (dihydrolipoamide acetyltransferase)
MPQMGESIAEGTVSKWLKGIGDVVERDEPILEISTDKVDAEIPAPASGTLVEIDVKEGETVDVGTVVAYIDTEPVASEDATVDEAETVREESREVVTDEPPSQGEGVATAPADGDGERPAADESDDEHLRTRTTPLVRRIAEEHGVDIERVEGTGFGGRVTKDDILAYLGSTAEGDVGDGGPGSTKEATEAQPSPVQRAPTSLPSKTAGGPASTSAPSDLWTAFYGEVEHPEFPVRESDTIEPMDKIRRLTAEHMVLAKRIAPHVHSFIEIDFTRVDRIRRENRARWEEQGSRVSFTAFVAWVCSRALKEFPTVNGTVSGNNIVLRGNVNLGIAVDLDPGLIVPVIHDADELSLVGIARRIADLAQRARSRQLKPQEIQGATFSITNPGVLGTLVGMPIVPKGTAAILGTGAIEKRPVVVDDPATGSDSIAIRKRALFSIGYDHRIVDGADAARFLARVKELMETFPDDA